MSTRAYRQMHKDKINAYQRAYYQAHKDKLRAYNRNRYRIGKLGLPPVEPAPDLPSPPKPREKYRLTTGGTYQGRPPRTYNIPGSLEVIEVRDGTTHGGMTDDEYRELCKELDEAIARRKVILRRKKS